MPGAGANGDSCAPRIGLVVSKAVGGSVERNVVKRRLRHALRERIASLPDGSVLVVRAQATAGRTPYPELVADLDRCLQRVLAGDAAARRPGQES